MGTRSLHGEQLAAARAKHGDILSANGISAPFSERNSVERTHDQFSGVLHDVPGHDNTGSTDANSF
jgi:hypothetical protein